MHENNDLETLSNNENDSSAEEESSQDESDSYDTESSDNAEEEDDAKIVNGGVKGAMGERENDDEETANDRLRQAVRNALGEAGVGSDNVSYTALCI